MMNKKAGKMNMAMLVLLTAFFMLWTIGTVNVFSATFAEDMSSGSAFGHLIRQLVFSAIGLIPAMYVFKRDYRDLKKHTAWLYAVTVLLLLAVLAAGVTVNGAKRWIGFAGFTFQPSELAKLTVILCTATILAPMIEAGKRIEFLVPWKTGRGTSALQRLTVYPQRCLALTLVLAVPVVVQPDAGTAIIIMALPILMLWISGARVMHVKYPLLAAAVLAGLCLLAAPYRMNRIVAWLDPWGYEKTLGYQTVQGLIAIGSGGIMGQGLGEGISKFSYLPEAHTDFAFAVLAQEWGLRGSLVMLLLFSAIIYYGCICAINCKDPFGRLLAFGVTMYFGVQGFINIGMVSGMLPVVGVPLPFISYGGTSLIVNMVAAGILLNICKSNRREAQRQAPAGTLRELKSMRDETRSVFRPGRS